MGKQLKAFLVQNYMFPISEEGATSPARVLELGMNIADSAHIHR